MEQRLLGSNPIRVEYFLHFILSNFAHFSNEISQNQEKKFFLEFFGIQYIRLLSWTCVFFIENMNAKLLVTEGMRTPDPCFMI